MFRCKICGKVSEPGARSHMVVLRTREKEYPTRGSKGGGRRSRFGPPVRPSTYDKGGEGHETVEEVIACAECAERVEKENREKEKRERREQEVRETRLRNQANEEEDVEQHSHASQSNEA